MYPATVGVDHSFLACLFSVCGSNIQKQGTTLKITRVCMGKRNLAQNCVLHEVTPRKSPMHFESQKQDVTLSLPRFLCPN